MNAIEHALKVVASEAWTVAPAPGGLRPMYMLRPRLFARFAPVHGCTGRTGKAITGLDLWSWQLIEEGPTRRRTLIQSVSHLHQLLASLRVD